MEATFVQKGNAVLEHRKWLCVVTAKDLFLFYKTSLLWQGSFWINFKPWIMWRSRKSLGKYFSRNVCV